MPKLLYPWESAPGTYWRRWWEGCRVSLDTCRREKSIAGKRNQSRFLNQPACSLAPYWLKYPSYSTIFWFVSRYKTCSFPKIKRVARCNTFPFKDQKLLQDTTFVASKDHAVVHEERSRFLEHTARPLSTLKRQEFNG